MPARSHARATWRAEVARTTPHVKSGFRAQPQRKAGEDRDPNVLRAVHLAKSGDEDALRYLYCRYADNVYGYIMSMVRDEHEAEDLTQHVFLKLMTVIHKYEPREVPFTAWIIRVARNVAVDHLRARRQVPCEEVFGADERASDIHHERRSDLRDALSELPQDQRDVVVLRHLVGLTPGEIAVRMGKTDASVHGLHHRARLTLRGELVRLEAAPATG